MQDGAVDLPGLDRDVRRAFERLDRWTASLATEEGRARAREQDPFDGVRHVAGQSTFRALGALEPGAHERDLRDGLRRWVYELLQARVGLELALDDADAVHARDPRLSPKATEGAPAPTFAAALDGLLEAPDAPRASLALERAADLALPVAAVRKERRARRAEVARRLELAHPFALATTSDVAALVGLARALLDRTEPLAKDVLARAARGQGAPWTAASAVLFGQARDAREGWPARLSARWLSDVFSALSPRAVTLTRLPAALGGASFLRAAAAYGGALRTAGAARALPFALARDPYPAHAHRFGFAFAAAVADPVFQRRVLGLSARAASAQARSLHQSMLLRARILAARFLLTADESVDRAAFEELSQRAFGAPLPASMRDAWPAPCAFEPARLVGVLGAPAFVRGLVARFDEDWFRNPRAGAHLASLACAPAWDSDPAPDDGPAEVARAFEEALG